MPGWTGHIALLILHWVARGRSYNVNQIQFTKSLSESNLLLHPPAFTSSWPSSIFILFFLLILS